MIARYKKEKLPPLNYILWWVYLWRVRRGKPAYVIFKGRFYLYSGVYKFPQQRIHLPINASLDFNPSNQKEK